MSDDSFTEVTHTSWFSRIGESIKGVLFGILLIALATFVLFWNEGRAVQTARSLTEGAAAVVDVPSTRVDPANEGRLVHVTGETKTTAPLNDADFGVSAQALKLVRNVEMYQWKEESKTETRKNFGGSEETVTTYTYVRTWEDHRIDSGKFRRPDGHTNPQMRYRRQDVIARDATLGAFRPGAGVLTLLDASQELRADATQASRMGGRSRGDMQVVDGKFYLGANPATPQIGDLRISHRVAGNGPVSIVGRQAGSDFAEYQTQAGDKLLMVKAGVASAADMFKAAEAENRMLTWALRLVGVVMMLIGFALLLQPLVVVADIVPLIGDILGAGTFLVSLFMTVVLAPLVIAVAWFWYRPVVAVIVIVGALAAAYGLKRLAAGRTAARRAPVGAA